MKLKIAIVGLICWALAQPLSGAVRGFHEFAPDQCGWCHFSPESRGKPPGLRPVVSPACARCHNDRDDAFSHPVNILPDTALPADMPLEEGRMACLTCHFAHPETSEKSVRNGNLLRKRGQGAHFCAHCHGLRSADHRVFEPAHRASIRNRYHSGTLDPYSLQCMECHDSHITRVSRTTGGGRWQPFDISRQNHPVGISYLQTAARFPRAFAPAAALPRQLRLYDDQIGCGTCHSAYSKARFMLTVDNSRSRLCLSCHAK